jgi:murein DD-endopeptidase MepM/ murein hydrolase activator NlpD
MPFDPGLETGYLRRAAREEPLPVEIGAAPFDPGSGTGYDERRAKRAAKRREREERKQQEQERRERERSEREARDHEGARQHEHAHPQPEHGGRRHSLAEQLEREREERERTEAARRAALEHQRARVGHRTTPIPRRRDLVGPTARAGLAVTAVLAVAGALGSLLGLPVPRLEAGSGGRSLLSSASLFGVDAGTPPGAAGYVFPLIGAHDFGDKDARFGASRYGHMHEGQDIFGKTGDPEIAVHDGVVVDRGKNTDPDDGGRGNYLVIYSPAENQSYVYMHMMKPPPVFLNQSVHAGQGIGQLGCTGSCEGPHLHFEVRLGKASFGADTKPIDPLPLLRQWPQSTPG